MQDAISTAAKSRRWFKSGESKKLRATFGWMMELRVCQMNREEHLALHSSALPFLYTVLPVVYQPLLGWRNKTSKPTRHILLLYLPAYWLYAALRWVIMPYAVAHQYLVGHSWHTLFWTVCSKRNVSGQHNHDICCCGQEEKSWHVQYASFWRWFYVQPIIFCICYWPLRRLVSNRIWGRQGGNYFSPYKATYKRGHLHNALADLQLEGRLAIR